MAPASLSWPRCRISEAVKADRDAGKEVQGAADFTRGRETEFTGK